MTNVGPGSSHQPAVSDNGLALIVYILYFIGYFTGVSALAGVIIAHVQVSDADPMLRSHYQFQISTFWIGLLYLTVGVILTFVVVGLAILLWWFIWSLVRCIKGILALNEGKAIGNPTSWLFG